MQLGRSIATGLAALAFSLPALGAHHEGEEMGKGRQTSQEKAAGGMEQAEEAMEQGEDARGEAMRERRDQRKAIMEETKGAAEPGAPPKGKKPWWKFWGADDEE